MFYLELDMGSVCSVMVIYIGILHDSITIHNIYMLCTLVKPLRFEDNGKMRTHTRARFTGCPLGEVDGRVVSPQPPVVCPM